VRFVQVDSVRRQLDVGYVVLLSNLGYSTAGEVLNCDIYSVATRAAIDLQADKLVCLTLPSTQPLKLPLWAPLSAVEELLCSVAAERQQQQGGSHQAEVDRALGADRQSLRPVGSSAPVGLNRTPGAVWVLCRS
jgi:acetylglutamate kinase